MNADSDTKAQDEVQRQRDYYAQTADRYESLHQHDQEHAAALAFLGGALDWLEPESLLDVGSGTGRVITYLKQRRPELRAVGIEPVAELRAIGHQQGLAPETLRDGDATRLEFDDNAFDVVSAFAVLHHIPRPSQAVAEMLRVARRAVFISDSNNFGQGGWAARTVKQTLRAAGLWPLAVWIKTGGKGHMESEEDGISYPYSLFDNQAQLQAACADLYWMNTRSSGPSLYRSASHVAVLAVKPASE